MSTSDTDPVEQIIYDCLERLAADEPDVVEAACRRFPQHADSIRDRLQMLQHMGLRDDEPQPFPDRLGEFRLLERIGQGGMGVVFLAEQEPLGRRVAVKLIRPECLLFAGSKQRFCREIEAVGQLKHPGIVQVFTVGESDGVPYFAMEWVEGCSLSEVVQAFAERGPGSLSGRDLATLLLDRGCASEPVEEPFAGSSWVESCLRLVRQVADALAHAHERGVLHRDVKPSNVLVTPRGRACLLDFGLASVPSRDAVPRAKLTRTGSQPGSLPYMAPEQLAGRPVDSRTDVYALGVTLYELLTLCLPYSGASESEIRVRIGRGDATAPSRLNPGVPWDAETVCMTAMERDPDRRYASAADFAADLTRVLELRPIAASRPALGLRVRRWVQRHPTLSVAILAILVAIPLLPTVGWLSARAEAKRTRMAQRKAERERELATAKAGSLHEIAWFLEQTFRSARPSGNLKRDTTVREFLDLGAARIDSHLSKTPAVRARLLRTFGDSYVNLGLHEKAAPLLERSFKIRRELHPADHAEVAETIESLAYLERSRDNTTLAVGQLRRAIEMWTRLLGEDHTEVARCRVALGQMLCELGELDDAMQELEAALATARARDDARKIADCLYQIGAVYLRKHDRRRAGRRFQEAIDSYRKVLPADSMPVALATSALGNALFHLRRFSRAEPVLRQALAVLEEKLAPSHPDLLICRRSLGCVLVERGRWKEAIPILRDVLHRSKELGATHALVADAHYFLGYGFVRAGESDVGEKHWLRALELLKATRGPDHPQVSMIVMNLIQLYGSLGRTEEAARLRRSLTTAERSRK